MISGRHFRNPVSLAKRIMYESRHCALSADGARKFAERHDIDFPTCDPADLISEPAKNRSIKSKDFPKFKDYYYKGKPLQDQESDTVSAVAMDKNGHLACATSTGRCNPLN